MSTLVLFEFEIGDYKEMGDGPGPKWGRGLFAKLDIFHFLNLPFIIWIQKIKNS